MEGFFQSVKSSNFVQIFQNHNTLQILFYRNLKKSLVYIVVFL